MNYDKYADCKDMSIAFSDQQVFFAYIFNYTI